MEGSYQRDKRGKTKQNNPSEMESEITETGKQLDGMTTRMEKAEEPQMI